ncbi:hypothetical protein BDN70DRAFT_873404 [Pholiota conissans]|uniref:DAGKc domain-containing protein n=1 Tax=Pholiota conissans TaxID=109636 RepID=A0A9P6CX81_9AGAR|nr:hypothetical protein BDN70DRAFT_873404 [Pholiota conissans]
MPHTTINIQNSPISHVKLTLNDTNLTVQNFTRSKPATRHDIGFRFILHATFDDSSRMKLAYLAKKKELHLVVLEGTVDEADIRHAAEWAKSVMTAVYEDNGIQRSRRFMVFVNPFGGKKKGASIFVNKVEPVLKIAGCSLEVLYTTHQGQAQELAKNLPLDFDAIVIVSGDGLIHEILNGFAEHADPMKAFSIPIAPIPTGSGNGLSLNILGPEEGFDVLAAALNAIKGQPMKVDVFSVTQGGRRSISFMSQALGLMADLDIGTDNLRWMGETRFLYGLLRGLVKYKSCPVQLSYKVAEKDKLKMAVEVSLRKNTLGLHSPTSASTQAGFSDTLPPLKYVKRDEQEDEEGWTTFTDPILYVYAGKGPYVGRDYMAFPVSLPDDGLIDLVVMTNDSRGDLISAMDGAPQGNTYWHPKVHYVKAHTYRVKPLQEKGHLAIDGERYPFEEFQVEVYKGLATLMSPYGHYAAHFEPRTPTDTP